MVPVLLSRSGDERQRREDIVKQPPADLQRLMPLVSRRTGIVKRLIPLTKGATEPTPPYIYCALLADHSYGGEVGRVAGVGKAETQEVAAVRALAEAVERYCATQLDPRGAVRASLASLETQALDPTDCVLYSDRQYDEPGFNYARFSDKTVMTWAHGMVLPGNESILIPSILVYLIPTWTHPEEYICPPSSNGLAAGMSMEMAILNGLLEVVERDAFMVSWLTRRRGPHIDYSRRWGLSTTVRNHYSCFGVEVVVIDITADLPIHVMMAIAIDHGGGGPAAVIGLGAGLDPSVAVEKALLEVCQGRPAETMRRRHKPPQERLRTFGDVRDTVDHGALFSMPHMLDQLDFLLEPGPPGEASLEELPDYSTGSVWGDIRFCIDALGDIGSKVICVDVTTPDIAPLGLWVVRTIVTGLQPIHFGQGEERMGGRRIFELPMKLGCSPRLLTQDDINPCPHPLA
jgi:ribosomal protein S12 methylthiotransferase accessory factor